MQDKRDKACQECTYTTTAFTTIKSCYIKTKEFNLFTTQFA